MNKKRFIYFEYFITNIDELKLKRMRFEFILNSLKKLFLRIKKQRKS